jgi:predicted nucleotide-binding protein
MFFTIKERIMEDREKVLRWNLQEAQKEMGKPTDIGGMLIASISFGIKKNREENLRKAQQELNDYLKNSKQK